MLAPAQSTRQRAVMLSASSLTSACVVGGKDRADVGTGNPHRRRLPGHVGDAPADFVQHEQGGRKRVRVCGAGTQQAEREQHRRSTGRT